MVQSLIYCRSNLRRAFDDFDDTDIAGISLVGDNVCITRTDGTSQEFSQGKGLRSVHESSQTDYRTSLRTLDLIIVDPAHGGTTVVCSKAGHTHS